MVAQFYKPCLLQLQQIVKQSCLVLTITLVIVNSNE